ncbi:hypothetical protein DVH24_002462 [Malus domestica]|uniref:Uncharacterized protein n=1 Tax=Malus domestica TaxID=3750 RepID=A0A498IT50_MALDO|nr:hypothetical protein DVH24_002462 [Malus domestica]
MTKYLCANVHCDFIGMRLEDQPSIWKLKRCALKMKARGEGWARIIVERIRTILNQVGNLSNSSSFNLKNWIPRLKKQSLEFKAYLEPNI